MVALIEKYRAFLPVSEKTPIVSLFEGNTPLLPAPRLSKLIGCEVFLKYEGANPTGSFKDRGMTMAVSKAAEEGARAVICASTGNTSASAAAYAARAGMKCVVLIPEGNVALGKLAQVCLTGASVVQINGNFDNCLDLVRYLSENYPIALVNSVNPYRIAGQTTGAFEVVDALGDSPDYQAMPVGNAGNITAYWAGYQTYKKAGLAKRLPTMLGFQAAGSAPIVENRIVEHPETVATAIRIGNPASWKQATAARDESGGLIDAVSDEQILEAWRLLSSQEGVFCEPASASGVAGALALAKKGFFKKNQRLVCILTGHGLKDPGTAMKAAPEVETHPADGEHLAKFLGLNQAL